MNGKKETLLQTVLEQMIRGWRTNPQWAAAQQDTTATASGIVGAIADTIISGFGAAQDTQDRLAQNFSNTLLEVERVEDPRTGQIYAVKSGSNYHWIDAQGNIMGTQTHFNPDGLRFEEMVAGALGAR